MATIKQSKTTNKELFDTIQELRKMSNKTGVGIYRAVAAKLAAPASQKIQVNLSKIERNAQEKEVVIVPGKVLGTGSLNKKVTIVGFSASSSALEKISKAGAKFVSIRDHISSKHDTKMRILG